MAKVKIGTLSDSVFELSESCQVIAQSGRTWTSLYPGVLKQQIGRFCNPLYFPRFYFLVEFWRPWFECSWDLSVIHVAARWGIIPLILTALQGGLEDKDDHGQSPLLIATENTQIDALRMLVQSGVPLDSRNNKHQNVLHVACKNGGFNDYTMVKSLLNKGVSPYICDDGNMTPFLTQLGTDAQN
jgi:hypothetical protein